ncbi:MAG: tRNA 2-thiouridine(34) synthase MnmA [Dehalococcoidia bacterium]|nr:MAG: tRNA 2-thiouridine(34) synthase MnmA [Dehalococcoidia bacterium]
MKVVVAMSGGVDSSVTAALLKEGGYEVIGATMQIWPSNELADEAERFGGCCGLGAVADAKRVAYKLGIPHYVMNFRDLFAQKVIANFCREYSLGRTPNPCIRCNEYIKFDALLTRAKELEADFVATGHYARIERDEVSGRYLLKKGVDRRKDQSYVLYVMTQNQLRHALMPLGGFTKERVRQVAGELGLPVADKAESQEICFIPDGDYTRFLKEYMPQAAKPGPVLDREGNTLGEHRGILFYTIGQRKGLGISAREPLYVVAIDRERNAIIVGTKREVYGDELIAANLNWIGIESLEQPLELKAKIRYRHREADAVITPILSEDRVHVKFKQPQMAMTRGQAIVFYHKDSVVGGGTIEQINGG